MMCAFYSGFVLSANTGIFYFILRKRGYDEAIDAFEVALGDILYKTPSLAEGNMGWAYYRMGKTDEGINNMQIGDNPIETCCENRENFCKYNTQISEDIDCSEVRKTLKNNPENIECGEDGCDEDPIWAGTRMTLESTIWIKGLRLRD